MGTHGGHTRPPQGEGSLGRPPRQLRKASLQLFQPLAHILVSQLRIQSKLRIQSMLKVNSCNFTSITTQKSNVIFFWTSISRSFDWCSSRVDYITSSLIFCERGDGPDRQCCGAAFLPQTCKASPNQQNDRNNVCYIHQSISRLTLVQKNMPFGVSRRVKKNY